MAFNSQLLYIYRTDYNAVFNIMFASLFYITISKPIPQLSDKTRQKKIVEKR